MILNSHAIFIFMLLHLIQIRSFRIFNLAKFEGFLAPSPRMGLLNVGINCQLYRASLFKPVRDPDKVQPDHNNLSSLLKVKKKTDRSIVDNHFC